MPVVVSGTGVVGVSVVMGVVAVVEGELVVVA